MTVANEVITFTHVQTALTKHFKSMSAYRLFIVNIDKEKIWELYLGSFPDGTNPVYKNATEFDCRCCRQFIRTLSGVVNIIDGKIITIWDFKVDGPFQEVAAALAAYVRNQVINNVYLSGEKIVGTANSRQLLEDRTIKTWEHFYVNLPTTVVMRAEAIGPKTGEFQATHDVMMRGLEEITSDAITTVLELIAQNSLYRGEEHKHSVEEFKKLQIRFKKLNNDRERDLFVWENLDTVHAAIARIKNGVIGTLLIDLSEGKELEEAVKSFETKVAPTNYKRPTALVTKAMIAQAQKAVNELGLGTALERRYATLDDLTVNNILYANRETKKAMNVFDELSANTTVDIKKLGKIEEIGINDFITKVMPSASSIEVLFENRHAGNMVSLIAPVDATAKPLFKWPNHFSWSYTGDLADSIKERVKAAGGSVTGDFRASLAWFNYDDLDFHLKGPQGLYIWFRNKNHRSGGALDVDMNAGSGKSRNAVENITFPNRSTMPEGEYTLFVNQFTQRETKDPGFEVEMEFDGIIYSFAWPNALKTSQNVVVCKFNFNRKTGLTILESLVSKQSSKSVWGLGTQTFQKVRAVMLSPNQWDGKEIGNKHYFFMLDGCVNDGAARGFFNEFLHESLNPHRKVLEMVGSKMQTKKNDKQLSGLGFSSTQHTDLLCRVNGSFSRIVKVII